MWKGECWTMTTTETTTEFGLAIRMFEEQRDVETFLKTLVALAVRGNELAERFIDSLLEDRRTRSVYAEKHTNQPIHSLL